MSTLDSTIKRIMWMIILLVIWKVLMNRLSQRKETYTNSEWVTHWQNLADNETLVNRKEQYNQEAERYRQLVIQEEQTKIATDAQATIDDGPPPYVTADDHIGTSKGNISDYTWLAPIKTPDEIAAASANAVAVVAKKKKKKKKLKKLKKKWKKLNVWCFSGSTKVKMASGGNMCIKDISLGDELAGGTLVDATMQIKNRSNDPFYRFNSTELGDCVYVTGSHYIHHDDKYIFVEDHPEAVLTDKCDDILYCLVTSDHTIPVGEFKFWDWEDNLIRH